jgi:O-antigen/teichoic acid export membrane protein
MSVKKRLLQLASESAIYGISGVIGSFISIFLIPVYTRIFTPKDYGVISLLTVFTTLVGMLAVLALDNSSARWFYDTDDLKHRHTTISTWFWCQLTVSSILALGIVFLAPQISFWLTNSPEYSNLVRLVAIGIPMATGSTVLNSWLRYQRRPTMSVVFSLSRTLANIGLIIVFVVILRRGLTGLFSANLIIATIFGIVSIVFLKNWVSPVTFSRQRLRAMLHYALPLIPAALGLWVMMGMDRIMLEHFANISEVGLYSIAASVASLIGLITAAFTQAWGPFAYSILKEPESGQVYSKVLDLYSFFGCAVCTGLALYAPLILRLLTTKAYYPAASTVSFLAFGTLLNGSRFIASLGCGIVKKSIPSAISVAIGASMNLVLNLLLDPHFGRNGAAFATTLSWAASVVYLFWASQRHYPIPYRWLSALLPLILSICLIFLDNWLINGNDLLPNLYRGALMLGFVPLGIILGILRWRNFKGILRITNG